MKKKFVDKFDPFKSNQLFGHSEHLNNLFNLHKMAKLPKVLMFSGEKGLGKFTLALHLAHLINTQNDKDSKYNLDEQLFSNKGSFYSSLESNTNQNFYYIGNNYEKSVTIDNVREIKKKLINRPLNGLSRIIIFDDADLFNNSSANSLLKIIEEPSEFNYFILINNQRNPILDTLKSRSIEIKIFLKRNEKKQVLSNLLKINNMSLFFENNIIYYLSPGILLRIQDILINNNIDLNSDPFLNIEILLDFYKKDKKYIFIDIIKLILDIIINQQILNKNSNHFYYNAHKSKINKLLYEFEKFNLSKNSIIESFRALEKNA